MNESINMQRMEWNGGTMSAVGVLYGDIKKYLDMTGAVICFPDTAVSKGFIRVSAVINVLEKYKNVHTALSFAAMALRVGEKELNARSDLKLQMLREAYGGVVMKWDLSQVAKIVDYGHYNLCHLLVRLGLITKEDGKHYVPVLGKTAGKGWFIVEQHSYQKRGQSVAYPKMYATQLGVDMIQAQLTKVVVVEVSK